jgi:hypothetical protein
MTRHKHGLKPKKFKWHDTYFVGTQTTEMIGKLIESVTVDDMYFQMWQKQNLNSVYVEHMMFVHLVHFTVK